MTLTIPQQLRVHARYRPGKDAIIDRDRSLTFAEVDRLVDGAAHALASVGISFGEITGVALPDSAEHLIVLLALGRIGATVLPLDPRWAPVEIKAVAAKFGAARILTDRNDPGAGCLRLGPGWLAASDVAYEDVRVTVETPFILSLSSGTTGIPKGPRVSHGKFVARFQVYWLDLALSGHDRFVTATPLYFGGGRGFALAMIYAGGTSLLFCPPYQPSELVEYVAREQGTAMFLVPTLLRRLLAEPPSTNFLFPTLRVLISSGSAIYPDEQRTVRARLSPFLYQFYSSTEGGGCTVLGPEAFEAHCETVGQPCFGVDVEVVDNDHRPLPTGAVGQLRYRSAASAENFVMGDQSSAFRDGWFYPGDLASVDPEGFFSLRGRAKDMIIRGGVNIYPGDIEAILIAQPGIREAAVAGVPSPEMGEEVVAFLVGKASESALRTACKRALARYKVPTRYLFIDELPKSGAGKIDKSALVRMITGG